MHLEFISILVFRRFFRIKIRCQYRLSGYAFSKLRAMEPYMYQRNGKAYYPDTCLTLAYDLNHPQWYSSCCRCLASFY